ncbi:MAG TPA: HesA/MoeB/ThiF family protein [Geobacteraceae bacterium]
MDNSQVVRDFQLRVFLLEESQEGTILPWSAQLAAAKRFDMSPAQVEACALELGVMPARYQRNRQTISTSRQLRLFRSRVAIIGCGGLGGYLIEELSRLGVGHLTLIDPDVFEEHNLNRQILSSLDVIGCPKVDVAAERVRDINPAVTVASLRTAFSPDNGTELLEGADVVLDGLDNVATRLALAHACREMAIPLVHGAIGGWYGQLAVQLPGEDISRCLAGTNGATKGVETTHGNPSFTPAVVASLQVAAACKILVKQDHNSGQGMLFVNLLDMEMERLDV